MLRIPLISVSAAVVIFIFVAYFTGGLPLLIEGFDNAKLASLKALPLLIAVFVIIGQLRQLLSADLINSWLKKYTGLKGIAACAVGGGWLPGNPYIIYPFLASIFQKGVPIHLLLSLIIGKRIYNFTRFPVEVGLINPQIALLRYVITLPVPLLMGFLAYRIFPQTIVTSLIKEEGESVAPTNIDF